MKKHKKYLSYILILNLSLLLTSCEVLKSRIVDFDKMRVGYVIPEDGIKDKSLGELGYEGIKRAENKYKVNTTILEGDEGNKGGLQNSLKKLIEKNDLVIVMGNDFKATINEVANNYRDKKIGAVGMGMEESNIQDVTFRYEEGGFLMGILSAKESETKKVAFIGFDKEESKKLAAGYIAGVKTVDNNAFNSLLKEDYVMYVKATVNENEVFNIAKDLYSKGVDIILTNLDIRTLGILKAAKSEDKNVISFGGDGKRMYPEYKENILSSLIVKVDNVLYNMISEVEEGKFKSGQKNNKSLGFKDGSLDISKETANNTSEEVIKLLLKTKNDIINNKIKIPNTRNEAMEF